MATAEDLVTLAQPEGLRHHISHLGTSAVHSQDMKSYKNSKEFSSV